MNEYFVYPGQLMASREKARIKTILGSCVSVVLWDRTHHIGGLCHYLLPEPTPGSVPSARYGSFAIPELLQRMLELGAQREHIQAKIYGGGNVVNHLNRLDGNIGDRNVEEAHVQLKALKIPVLESNIGGTKGRVIALDTSSFNVDHRFSDNRSESETLSGVTLTSPRERVRVLIVDDSATVRTLFSKALAQSSNIEVVGTATDPFDAREKIIALKPDVLTLDIEMPRMNGVAFLEKLMKHHPMPVVMVSSLGADGEAAQRALELGAVEFVQKPSQYDPALLSELGEILIQKIIAASTAQLKSFQPIAKPTAGPRHLPESGRAPNALRLITVGGNVGCSEPLAALIRGLASDTPPVVVSASTISSFIGTYTQRLQPQCRVELQILRMEETQLTMGKVYFATADSHVQIHSTPSGGLVARLEKGGPFFGQKPSSEKLFQSAAEAAKGSVCGILLSSFSADGIAGLLKIRETGGITVVQNPEECSFNATPAAAIEKGAADYILNAVEIPGCLMELRNRKVLQTG
ncbi:MAG TPA: chemotaxis protein CheB [Oligoflexus sp.]|uniref:chemotaxis protein CheB n=1 Tax=Oligoflexus sp. TaxID=1971216 RepID=UPI002D671A81|nr:chemotaxis protein CheB [Oligoflexus sp.]HYX38180.1 chemotaxis protein CheB [Oligoflexus sp.]